MAYFQRQLVSLAGSTAAGGSTAYTADPVTGCLSAFYYKPSTSKPLATAETITVTGAETGISYFLTALGTAAVFWLPVGTLKSSTGGTVLFTSASAASKLRGRLPIVNERLKIVLTQSTAAAVGTLYVFTGD